jgi:cobalt/nickel transport protein
MERRSRMKKWLSVLWAVFFLFNMSGAALAHFGMVIPSDSMVMPGETRVIRLTCSFSHPMEMIGMELVKPVQFGVFARGTKKSLLEDLKETKVMGQKAWMTDYRITRPGVYTFFMEPTPYWEPAEDCYIIHYTKTIISAFGDEEGWDEPLGLKTEIVPLTRPFGLYSGNVFQGVVMLDGKPVPHAEVEVEYYNKNGKALAPTEYMITQVIKADAAGVFTYAVPRSGWWGFAALNTSDKTINHEGEDKDVEIGAVLWVEFQNWKEK